jgi:hypothetical protein
MKLAQNDIMGARNVNVSISENENSCSLINESENENSCSLINESENDFMDNLYNHGLPMFRNFF